MRKTVFIGSLLAGLAATPFNAVAAPDAFLDGLSGNWAGSGKAYVRGLGNVSASCNMNGGSNPKSMSMNGRCGVLFFKIGLGLKLKHEGNGEFSGVYTGSRTGPARLAGTLSGNRVPMAITWGGEVNGDRNAEMILTRTGAETFSLAVFDQVGGKRRQTSRFTFRKR